MSARDLVVDLFAGPGGWSEGLRSVGLEDVGIEWDDAACRTRAAAGHPTIRADVAQYPTAKRHPARARRSSHRSGDRRPLRSGGRRVRTQGPSLVASFSDNREIRHPLDVVDAETVMARFELLGIPRDLWVLEEGE